MSEYDDQIKPLDGWKDQNTGLLRYYEQASCLVGADGLVNSLKSARKCDESGARDINVPRTQFDVEMSIFGILGELAVRTLGELDINRNGNIDKVFRVLEGRAGDYTLESPTRTILLVSFLDTDTPCGATGGVYQVDLSEVEDQVQAVVTLSEDECAARVSLYEGTWTKQDSKTLNVIGTWDIDGENTITFEDSRTFSRSENVTGSYSLADTIRSVFLTTFKDSDSSCGNTEGKYQIDLSKADNLVSAVVTNNDDICEERISEFQGAWTKQGSTSLSFIGTWDIDGQRTVTFEDELGLFSESTANLDIANANTSSFNTDTTVFQAISEEEVYLVQLGGSFFGLFPKCLNMGENYTGILPDDFADEGSGFTCLNLFFTKLVPIVQIDELTRIFSEEAGDKLTRAFVLSTTYAERAAFMRENLIEIGFNPENDFLEVMDKVIKSIDNGGQCLPADELGIFNLLTTMAASAAVSETDDLKEKNVVQLETLKGLKSVVDVEQMISDNCPGMFQSFCEDMTQVRLVYKKADGGYTNLYPESIPDRIRIPLEVFGVLSKGDPVANDQIITFQELLCFSSESVTAE